MNQFTFTNFFDTTTITSYKTKLKQSMVVVSHHMVYHGQYESTKIPQNFPQNITKKYNSFKTSHQIKSMNQFTFTYFFDTTTITQHKTKLKESMISISQHAVYRGQYESTKIPRKFPQNITNRR